MKTIEEAAREELNHTLNVCNSFKRGVEFAQRWIPVEEELPICYESGNWDGLRSDYVIIKFKNGDWTKARLYSGTIDGSKFNDWYGESEYMLLNITHWRPIELK